MTAVTAVTETRRPLVVPGDKVALAMMIPADVADIARWHQNLEFTALMGTPGEIQTVEMRQEAFQRGGRPSSSSVEFAVVTPTSGSLVGFGGLFDISRARTASLFVGIDPALWGQGYGTEATRLICAYGFFFLSLYSIHLQVHAYNAAGLGAYERVGFKYAGRLRGVLLLDGARHDDILMDLLRDEFIASQIASQNEPFRAFARSAYGSGSGASK
ncbi:MAG TPA: GNAT family protein [Kofleriaceae bacterium]